MCFLETVTLKLSGPTDVEIIEASGTTSFTGAATSLDVSSDGTARCGRNFVKNVRRQQIGRRGRSLDRTSNKGPRTTY